MFRRGRKNSTYEKNKKRLEEKDKKRRRRRNCKGEKKKKRITKILTPKLLLSARWAGNLYFIAPVVQ
jgi:hypothetical protein